jgi:hypothetical protein
LDAFDDDGPRRLLLNTHPELWLDASVDAPLDYLESTILPIGIARVRAGYEDEAKAWRGHRTATRRA